MPLTNVQPKQARPGSRPLHLFDGAGLFLLITPAGQRYWRLKYRFTGKEKLPTPGVCPEVALLKARKLREDAREKLRDARIGRMYVRSRSEAVQSGLGLVRSAGVDVRRSPLAVHAGLVRLRCAAPPSWSGYAERG
ncbi:Arm DNA-binding domain-containing protein [Paraburkholderia sp.]|uniref:Arm DNA-binding domain-containing protein n=1 Tax=Paraburkholderia sp. TaxID=1926495 RepID=UPI00345DA771